MASRSAATRRHAIRFGDELLHGASFSRSDPGGLLVGCGGRVVHVPEDAVPSLDATIASLAAESARNDEYTADLQRHLLSTVLLWTERWYDDDRAGRSEADDDALQLYRRFGRVLERDYASHHDVAHYADALAVPPAALSQALAQASGRSRRSSSRTGSWSRRRGCCATPTGRSARSRS